MPRRFSRFFASPVLFILLCMAALLPTVAEAHPHVFVKNRIEVLFDEKGLEGFQVKWVFDEMFTAMVLDDILGGVKGPLSPENVAEIKKTVFDYLREYDYFTYIKINKEEFRVKFIRDFSARVEDGRLVYSFLVPCHVTAISSWKSLVISQSDPTYYTAIKLAKNPAGITKKSGSKVEGIYSIKEEEHFLEPREITVRFRKVS